MTGSFLNGFKISDIDQLILALIIFRFGVILVNKIGRKVSCVCRYKLRHSLNIKGAASQQSSYFANYSPSIAMEREVSKEITM